MKDTGATSILRIIRSAAALARMLPTFDLSCVEKAARWHLKKTGEKENKKKGRRRKILFIYFSKNQVDLNVFLTHEEQEARKDEARSSVYAMRPRRQQEVRPNLNIKKCLCHFFLLSSPSCNFCRLHFVFCICSVVWAHTVSHPSTYVRSMVGVLGLFGEWLSF